MTKYVILTHTIEHYDSKTNGYATKEELEKMIAEGKQPSYDYTSLGQLVDSVEDAKILLRAHEIGYKNNNLRDSMISEKKIYKLEEVA